MSTELTLLDHLACSINITNNEARHFLTTLNNRDPNKKFTIQEIAEIKAKMKYAEAAYMLETRREYIKRYDGKDG